MAELNSRTAEKIDEPDTVNVLYVDDAAERQAVSRYLGQEHDAIAVETAASLDAVQSTLQPEAYDCVVVELTVGEQSPAAVATTLREAVGETPLIAYTSVGFTDMAPETLSAVTTVVQKGEDVHRRFLANKILATVTQPDEEIRSRALATEFADQRAGTFLLGPDGSVETATTPYTDLFPGEAPPGSHHDRIEAHFDVTLRHRMEGAVHDGKTVTGRVAKLSTAGEGERLFACWSLPLPDGRQVEFYREATERIERRENLETLETLVELAHDGLYTVDADGKIKYCNEAFAEMLDRDRRNLVGEYAYSFMAEGALRNGQRIVQEVYENPDEVSQVIEQRLAAADEEVWLAVQCAALAGEGGTYGGLANVARDVTERKERKRKLERQQARLEEKNEKLESVAEVVTEKFREPLTETGQALADDDPDAAAFDRFEAAIDTIRGHVDDHLEITPEEEAAEPVVPLPSESESTPADDAIDENADAVLTSDVPDTTDVRLCLLYVDGDDASREAVATHLDDEPDVEVEAVDSLSLARERWNAAEYGAVVVDPVTLDVPFSETLAAVGDDETPVLVYATRLSEDLYDGAGESVDAVLEKGGERNRSFLVEKLRSLSGIGRPGDADVSWQSKRIERLGSADDLLVAWRADGDIVETTPSVDAFVSGLDADVDDFDESFGEQLANADQYRDWLASSGEERLLCELPTGDGHRFYHCWRWSLLGEEYDAVTVYRDVTDEIDYHDRLARARTLVERARDQIHVLDENARIVYCNPADADFFGYDRGELLGMDATQLVAPEDLQTGQEAVQRLVENPDLESAVVEMDVLAADGERRTGEVNYTLTPFDEDGSYTGVMAVGRDITERKQRERELRHRQEQLRRRNQLLERFSSILSHDLRNPLNVAIGHIDLARDGRAESVTELRWAVERMQEMLDELLSFARLGGDVEAEKALNLTSVVREAWGALDADAGTLVVDCGEQEVAADRAKLLHVFENLFRNSTEYGGENVTIQVGRTADGFYIEDDGPGIPESERENVFEYGYSNNDGTGIGLALARDVVRAHGWEITATESEAGGARFAVDLAGRE